MDSSTLASATSSSPAARARSRLTVRLLRHPGMRIGGTLVAVVIAGALLAPLLTPYDPITIAPERRLQQPSTAHPMGTDIYGRDTLTRVLYGGRISLAVGVLSVGLSLAVGGTIGTLAGFIGGWPDVMMMRVADILLAFPAILLAIGLLAFLGGGFWNVVIAIAIVYTAPFSRVARAAVLSVRHDTIFCIAEFEDTIRVMGALETKSEEISIGQKLILTKCNYAGTERFVFQLK